MGQAFYIANLTKKQYLLPSDCGDNYKLPELQTSLEALAILLSNDDDHHWGDAPMHGDWSGDSIAVVGEYSDISNEIISTYDVVDVRRLMKFLEEQ